MSQSFVVTEDTSIVMIARPLIAVIVCFGFIIILQSLIPKVMALKRSSKMNEFLLEDQRTRKRKNYVVKMARENEMLGNSDNPTSNYDIEPFPSDANPQELSAFIVDYANLIRNDVILLDNSVETRTRKRGNIKVKKYNQAIPDPPCNCEYNRKTLDFGEHIYPRFVETRNCTKEQQTCLPPYVCKENLYDITIIRRRESLNEDALDLPAGLRYQWIPEKRAVSVGCGCINEYLVNN